LLAIATMALVLNSMHKYFNNSRLLVAPTGHKGPYAQGAVLASPSNNGGAPSLALDKGRRPLRPFIEPDLTVLAKDSVVVSAKASSSVFAQVAVSIGGSKKKNHPDGNKTWKPEWSVEFLWAKPQFDDKRDVSCVRCYICLEVRERPMLIKKKRDNLLKHSGSRRTKSQVTT
jgi:hypothetical protein